MLQKNQERDALDFAVWRIIREARDSNAMELHLDGGIFGYLDKIPDDIFELENLRILEISGGWDSESRTNIMEIPPSIAKLKNLETLNLRKNRIKRLPKELFELKNLRELYLDYNELETIDSGIENLVELKKLNLLYNNLIELPLEIGQIENLEDLKVGIQRIKNVPIEILRHSGTSLINYLKSVVESKTIKLFEAKLLTHVTQYEATGVR